MLVCMHGRPFMRGQYALLKHSLNEPWFEECNFHLGVFLKDPLQPTKSKTRGHINLGILFKLNKASELDILLLIVFFWQR